MIPLMLALLAQVHVNFTGAPPFPSVPPIDGISSESIEDLQQQLLGWYLYEGYPFAALSMYFSAEDTLVVNAVPGRHAALEAIAFPDSVKTSRSVLLRNLELHPGEPYSPTDVNDWLREVERLDFIQSAGPPLLSLGQGGNLVMTVPVEEEPQGWFSGDIDYSGTTGVSGGGETVFGNLFGTGRRLELRFSTVEWGGVDASGLYREPWLFGSDLSVQLEASQTIPDSGSVIRETEGSVILDLGALEISGGGGVWRSYPLSSGDESYRYGSAGISWDLTRRLPQGRAGFAGSVVTDAGSASGPDSTWFLTRSECSMSSTWFRGPAGLTLKLNCGGITSGEWLSTMLEGIGGYGTLRGYVSDTWRAGTWGLGTAEISLGETSTRIYVFSDGGLVNTGLGKLEYPVSAGVGLRGRSGGLRFDAGTGIPLNRDFDSARFYLSAQVSI